MEPCDEARARKSVIQKSPDGMLKWVRPVNNVYAVIFGDPAEFKALLAESKTHFARARELDPTDETSSYYAFFLGPEGHGSKDEGGAAAQPTSDEPFEN